MSMRQGLILITLFFTVFFSGCDNNQNLPKTGDNNLTADFAVNPKKSAWLRDHLPDETLAYINIPTPWNFLFDPKADAMHSIQSLPAHDKQVAAIKQGIKKNYYQYIPQEFQSISQLILEHMNTSMEIALINFHPTAMLPTVALGTRMKGLDSSELEIKLNETLQSIDPSIALTKLEQAGQWTFVLTQFTVFVQYDEASGQLLMFGGMGANKKNLVSLWESGNNQLTAIKELGHESDPSGLNLKMWVAPARMFQLGGSFIPSEQQEMINLMGLDQMDYIWLGTESTQGHSATVLHVLMPETGWRLMLPRANEWFDVTTDGTPHSVVQLTVPTSDQIRQAIDHFKLNNFYTEADRKSLQEITDLESKLGFKIYDILDASHQQFYFITDDSGSWMAGKIKDQKLFDMIDQKSNEFFQVSADSKTLAGVKINQAHIATFQKLFPSKSDDKFEAFLNLFKDHFYWYVVDDVYYMSSIPQILADKKNTTNPKQLSSWLNSNQGGNWNSAILAYGKDVKNLPQGLYHFYLGMIQAMGDLAGVNIDLFELPTAKELGLPESGRLNLSLSSDIEKVSVKYSYEYSFAEGIINSEGGFVTIAVIGILAAYAIPAYKDYTLRAKVGEQMAYAAGAKIAISEYWMTENTFVGAQEGIDVTGMSFSIDQEYGTIVIALEDVDPTFEVGDEIHLEPVVENGYIEWVCYSNIKDTYLPQYCKN